jgi:hypothetical protein
MDGFVVALMGAPPAGKEALVEWYSAAHEMSRDTGIWVPMDDSDDLRDAFTQYDKPHQSDDEPLRRQRFDAAMMWVALVNSVHVIVNEWGTEYMYPHLPQTGDHFLAPWLFKPKAVKIVFKKAGEITQTEIPDDVAVYAADRFGTTVGGRMERRWLYHALLPGDGDCLYHTLLHQLSSRTDLQDIYYNARDSLGGVPAGDARRGCDKLRVFLAAEMATIKRGEDAGEYAEEQARWRVAHTDDPFAIAPEITDAAIAETLDTSSWGTSDQYEAFARVFNLSVYVFNDRAEMIAHFVHGPSALYLHQQGAIHFDSLVPPHLLQENHRNMYADIARIPFGDTPLMAPWRTFE